MLNTTIVIPEATRTYHYFTYCSNAKTLHPNVLKHQSWPILTIPSTYPNTQTWKTHILPNNKFKKLDRIIWK